MLHKYVQTILFSLCLLASSMRAHEEESLKIVKPDVAESEQIKNDCSWSSSSSSSSSDSDSDSDDSCNNLKLGSLCAKKVKAGCIGAKSVNSTKVCADTVNANTVCAQKLNTSGSFCAPSMTTTNLCAGNANVASLCANTILANSLEQCGVFRATIVLSSQMTYTLGSIVDFDTILDDPNGNVFFGPTRYIAPRSGYYIVSVQIDQTNLQGAAQVLGLPITGLAVLVNGVIYKQSFVPYLSFHDAQDATLTALISLKAGDVVTTTYSVYVLTDAGGFQPYVGTVQLFGNGTDETSSAFKIHLLSNDCPPMLCQSACDTTCTSLTDCPSCSAVDIPCCS